jgi:hypothetical protein
MPRFEFKGSFYFATPATQTAFGAAVQNYMDAHPAMFTVYPGESGPLNAATADHSGNAYQLCRGHLTTRTDLDTLFGQMKTQAQTRGAIAPSTMWLKQVADAGGVTDSVWTSAANGWADVTPSPE